MAKYSADTQINLRCKPEDKAAFMAAAQAQGRTLANWVMFACRNQLLIEKEKESAK